jgi:hypothetical protein
MVTVTDGIGVSIYGVVRVGFGVTNAVSVYVGNLVFSKREVDVLVEWISVSITLDEQADSNRAINNR